jgi:serine/threonine-protein kinase
MSPEQARGVATDLRSDLYSLGCVLFEMLTGRVPYDGDTTMDILNQHISSPIPLLIGPDGSMPEVVERVVTRAMAKRPEERYQSSEEMLADLGRAERAMARVGWRRWLPS